MRCGPQSFGARRASASPADDRRPTGRGGCVSIERPRKILTRTVAVARPVDVSVSSFRADRARRHVVLVVDDFADTRDAIVEMLLAKGFDSVGAASGSIALELF